MSIYLVILERGFEFFPSLYKARLLKKHLPDPWIVSFYILFDIMYIKSCVSLVLSLEYLFLFVSFINGINCFLKMIKFLLIFLFGFLAVDFSWKLEILFLPQFWYFLYHVNIRIKLYIEIFTRNACALIITRISRNDVFLFSQLP